MEMNEIERIDNYIANRLSAQEVEAFEKELEGNPSLKEEVQFQRQVADGIRKARAAELKRMLNNIPVSGNTWGPGKIAATALTAGLVLTALYYYSSDNDQVAATAVTTHESGKIEEQPIQKTEETTSRETMALPEKEDKTSSPVIKTQPKKNEEPTITTPVTKPALDVVDPSEEMINDNDTRTESASAKGNSIEVSKMEVVTSASEKKYNFHYQFQGGKLMLYGPFDKNLYEVLEIHGDSHALFLYFKNNYYLLDEKQTKIKQLTPIRDAELLKRLREYRAN